MSGNFRAAVFGINDGLVSNVALVMGVMATGVPDHIVLITGISGLLSGALSMAAGEYISVRSQTELLDVRLQAARARLASSGSGSSSPESSSPESPPSGPPSGLPPLPPLPDPEFGFGMG